MNVSTDFIINETPKKLTEQEMQKLFEYQNKKIRDVIMYLAKKGLDRFRIASMINHSMLTNQRLGVSMMMRYDDLNNNPNLPKQDNAEPQSVDNGDNKTSNDETKS